VPSDRLLNGGEVLQQLMFHDLVAADRQCQPALRSGQATWPPDQGPAKGVQLFKNPQGRSLGNRVAARLGKSHHLKFSGQVMGK